MKNKDLGFIEAEDSSSLIHQINEIIRMLASLIKSLE
jgi:hypothetical protein